MNKYKLKTGKIGNSVVDCYNKIEEKFCNQFLNEDGSLKYGKTGEKVIDGYKKIEDSVVKGYQKIEDAFVETFLEKVEDESNK